MNPPDAAEQLEILVPFVAGTGLRDQRETMERPFFSLAKNKRTKPIRYSSPDARVFVTVTANETYGMATIWDADILIWAASVLCEMKKQGKNDIPRKLTFHPNMLLRTIGRETGGKEYRALKAALARLASTSVATNIRADDRRKDRQFTWIGDVTDEVDRVTKASKGMSITVSDWFYEGVMQEGGVLAIDPAYFAITGGRERWLYRVARKHAGGAGPDGFAIGMRTLFEKSGAEGEYARFKFEMLKLVAADPLPGFALEVEVAGRGEPMIRMSREDGKLAVAKAARGKEEPDQHVKPPWAPKPAKQQKPASFAPKTTKTLGRANYSLFRHLSADALNAARLEAKGRDVYALQDEFNRYLDGDPKREPRNYEQAFVAFVRQKIPDVPSLTGLGALPKALRPR